MEQTNQSCKIKGRKEFYVAPCVETISTCLDSILCGSTGGTVDPIGDGGDD